METIQLTVTLTRSPEYGLGIEISGGTDSRQVNGTGNGIYVNAVIPGGPAEGQLMPGDVLLGCNGNSMRRVTHDAAIALLQRSSVISLLIERTKANRRGSTATENGSQRPLDNDEFDSFTVEVTFSVRSSETQKSHLVVSKTLESINGVSVQQLTSPAHLARLVDSAQSTTLRYKLLNAQAAIARGESSSNLTRNGNSDYNLQQHPQLSRQKSDKGEKEKQISTTPTSQRSPKLPMKQFKGDMPYGKGADLITGQDNPLPSYSGYLSGEINRQSNRSIETRKLNSPVGSPAKDFVKSTGVQLSSPLSGQYGVKAGGSPVANGRGDFMLERRGSDNHLSNGRRVGTVEMQREEPKYSSSYHVSGSDEETRIDQVRTRRQGQVYNPLETSPVSQFDQPQRANGQTSQNRNIDKGHNGQATNGESWPHPVANHVEKSIARSADEPDAKPQDRVEFARISDLTSARKNDQSYIHRKVQRPVNNLNTSPAGQPQRQQQPALENRAAFQRESSVISHHNQHWSDQKSTSPVVMRDEVTKNQNNRPQSQTVSQQQQQHQQHQQHNGDLRPVGYIEATKSNNSITWGGTSNKDRRGSEITGVYHSEHHQNNRKKHDSPTGQRERLGSYSDEQSVDNRTSSQKHKTEQTAPEQTRLVLPDHDGSIGVKLDGGNAVGIFIKNVTPGAAAERAGIRTGDRLVAVDDRSLVSATKEEALLTLLRANGRALQVTLVQDSSGHRSFLASRQPGDRFYVRAHFSHSTPGPGETGFRRNNVFLVQDTLAGGVVGNWEAVRVHPPPAETEARLIPCANRADQIVMAAAGSELPTAFPPYERVAQRRAQFCRPVIIFGPFADMVRSYLVKSLPDRFEQPKQAGQTVKLSVIRSVVSRGKHCVLDLNPVAVDRLCFAQLAPIVLFVRPANRMVVKKIRKERGSKRLFQESLRMERWCSHLFTGVFTVDQPDLSALLVGLDSLIHLQQCQMLWLAEKDERPVRALSEPNLCCTKSGSSHERDEDRLPDFLGLSDNSEDFGYENGHHYNRPASCCSHVSGHSEETGDPFEIFWQPPPQPSHSPSDEPLSRCSGLFDFSGGLLRCSRTDAALEVPPGALPVGRQQRLQLAVLGSRTLLLGPPGVRFLRPVIVHLPSGWPDATLVTANLSESGQASNWAELEWRMVGDGCMSGDRFGPLSDS